MTTPVSRNAVIAFFQAYSSRDPVRIAPFIADDVEWMIVGPVDLLQFCGRRKGKEAVIDLFQRVIPNVLDVSGVESDIVLVDGDRAATYNRITAIQRTTGRTISYRSAQFMRFRNDKVIEISLDHRQLRCGRAGARPSDRVAGGCHHAGCRAGIDLLPGQALMGLRPSRQVHPDYSGCMPAFLIAAAH